MATITINIPNNNYDYLKDDNVFQSVITEAVFDYVEKKQDLDTSLKLSKSNKFKKLNNKLEEKL
jgi:hypothetical protein